MSDNYTDAWLCVECFHEKSAKFDPTLTDNYDPETEDGFREFSWTPCWLCNSPLGGHRIRFAYWGEGVDA